jgi:hypothetical protein
MYFHIFYHFDFKLYFCSNLFSNCILIHIKKEVGGHMQAEADEKAKQNGGHHEASPPSKEFVIR